MNENERTKKKLDQFTIQNMANISIRGEKKLNQFPVQNQSIIRGFLQLTNITRDKSGSESHENYGTEHTMMSGV